MNRKTLKVSEETKERLDELKREGETTDGVLNRAFDALEDDGDLEETVRQAIRDELAGEQQENISNSDGGSK